jgi:hypothetical protein
MTKRERIEKARRAGLSRMWTVPAARRREIASLAGVASATGKQRELVDARLNRALRVLEGVPA